MNGSDRPLLRQKLRQMLALHWQVAWDELRRKLPPDVEPREIDGHYWVSLIATEVSEVELTSPLPLPSIPPFRQIELRTPVTAAGGIVGVRHLSFDVSSSTLAAALRTMLGIDGTRADVQIEVEGQEERRVRLTAKRDVAEPISCSIEVIASGLSHEPAAGSVERELLAPPRAFAGALGSIQRIDATVPEMRISKGRVTHLEETFLWAASLTRPSEDPVVHYLQDLRTGLGAPRPL